MTKLSVRQRVTDAIRQVSAQVRRQLAVGTVGVLVAGWVGLIGWLLMSGPTVKQAGVSARLECKPIGKGPADDTYYPDSEFFRGYIDDGYIGARLNTEDYSTAQWIELDNRTPSEAFRVCSDARTNRMTSLVLAVSGGLALVVVGTTGVVIRRLTIMSTAPPEDS